MDSQSVGRIDGFGFSFDCPVGEGEFDSRSRFHGCGFGDHVSVPVSCDGVSAFEDVLGTQCSEFGFDASHRLTLDCKVSCP